MAKHRRFLVTHAIAESRRAGFPAAQEAAFAACPEAARFTDEEAEEFWVAARYIDWIRPADVGRSLRWARVTYPPDISFDAYRLGRHLFRRWDDPAVRQGFLERGISIETRGLAKLRRTRQVSYLYDMLEEWGSPATLWLLRRHDMADLIPAVLESFTEALLNRHRALLLYGKLTLHRFLTEPEPAKALSPWEQRKLARRLQLREVQLRSMRGSLRKLGRERSHLLDRLRDLGRVDRRELDALAAELAELRAQRAEEDRQHAAAIEAQANRYREVLARLRADVAAAERGYEQALAVRRTWLPAPRG
ncbi:MAG: hypothetical protein ACOY94_16360 [Bacillota bacterium]